MGSPEAGETELWQALRTAQAEDFVRELPHGLQSPVSQGGTNFSGGQRQRLCIARRAAPGRPGLPVRRQFFRPGLRHGRQAPRGHRTAAALRHRPDRRRAGGDHRRRRTDPRARRRPARRAGNAQGTHGVLAELPGDRGLPACPGGNAVKPDKNAVPGRPGGRRGGNPGPVPVAGRRPAAGTAPALEVADARRHRGNLRLCGAQRGRTQTAGRRHRRRGGRRRGRSLPRRKARGVAAGGLPDVPGDLRLQLDPGVADRHGGPAPGLWAPRLRRGETACAAVQPLRRTTPRRGPQQGHQRRRQRLAGT